MRGERTPPHGARRATRGAGRHSVRAANATSASAASERRSARFWRVCTAGRRSAASGASARAALGPRRATSQMPAARAATTHMAASVPALVPCTAVGGEQRPGYRDHRPPRQRRVDVASVYLAAEPRRPQCVQRGDPAVRPAELGPGARERDASSRPRAAARAERSRARPSGGRRLRHVVLTSRSRAQSAMEWSAPVICGAVAVARAHHCDTKIRPSTSVGSRPAGERGRERQREERQGGDEEPRAWAPARRRAGSTTRCRRGRAPGRRRTRPPRQRRAPRAPERRKPSSAATQSGVTTSRPFSETQQGEGGAQVGERDAVEAGRVAAAERRVADAVRRGVQDVGVAHRRR